MPGREKTWISRDIKDLYSGLYKYGYAHSTEVWREGRLVGGQFGVSIGGYFSVASLFHTENNAGKVGFALLAKRLRERGFTLFDMHVPSATTAMFGGFEMPLSEFRVQLAATIVSRVRF